MVLYDACRAMFSMTELLGVHRGSRSRTLDWVPSSRSFRQVCLRCAMSRLASLAHERSDIS
jgi:hypothetical protein